MDELPCMCISGKSLINYAPSLVDCSRVDYHERFHIRCCRRWSLLKGQLFHRCFSTIITSDQSLVQWTMLIFPCLIRGTIDDIKCSICIVETAASIDAMIIVVHQWTRRRLKEYWLLKEECIKPLDYHLNRCHWSQSYSSSMASGGSNFNSQRRSPTMLP